VLLFQDAPRVAGDRVDRFWRGVFAFIQNNINCLSAKKRSYAFKESSASDVCNGSFIENLAISDPSGSR